MVRLRAQHVSTAPLSIRTVATLLGVPKSTLHRHAAAVGSVRVGRPPRLAEQDEKELYLWVVHRADMNQPVQPRALRATVGALATARGLRFAGPQNAPTRWWLYGFVARHGDIIIAGAKMLHHAMPTRVQFHGWFAKLKVTPPHTVLLSSHAPCTWLFVLIVRVQIHLDLRNIKVMWNYDESGIDGRRATRRDV